MSVLNPSLFSSKDYVLYRFDYPDELFLPIRAFMLPREPEQNFHVLDLGCGTGLVTESFLRSSYPNTRMHLIDVDATMLSEAKERFKGLDEIESIQCSKAENIPLADHSLDLILIGSAWHWMQPNEVVAEVDRVLKPGGAIYIFEYQFPKSLHHQELNDWIRKQFNTQWKPESQVPRGSLKELTQCWRNHRNFAQWNQISFLSHRNHHASELAGVIFSQSRYQHFEKRFSPDQQRIKRKELTEQLFEKMGEGHLAFSYLYEGYVWRKRV